MPNQLSVNDDINNVVINNANQSIIITTDGVDNEVSVTQPTTNVVIVNDSPNITIIENNVEGSYNDQITVNQSIIGTSIVSIVQPEPTILVLNSPGPQGPIGPQGPQGPAGTGTIDSSSFVTTSSFNAFTSSYYVDSASFNNRINSITTSSLATTGSNIFRGNQIVTGSVNITGSLTVNTVNVGQNTINFIDNNSNIINSLSISSSNLVLISGSILTPQGGLTGSLFGTASWAINSLTASFAPNYVLNSTTSSFVQNSQTSSFVQNSQTSSFVTNSQTGSFVQNNQTSSFVTTSSFNDYTSSIKDTFTSFITTGSFGGTQSITGSLIISQNLTVFGTASYVYVTASQLDVGTNTISVNIFEPAQRFGGLVVYDSGSLSHQATASLLWDSQNNHWIYQNASGSTYNGGMLLSGPRNFGALGDEPSLVANYIVKSQGGDHITTSSLFDSGGLVRINNNTEITGSLSVSGSTNLTNSSGTTVFSSNADTLIITGSLLLTGSMNVVGLITGTSSFALTASYIDGGFY